MTPEPYFHSMNDAPGDEFVLYGPRLRESYWRRIGGGSLFVSITVHLLFILVALFLITFVTKRSKQEEAVDFLPGGGGGGKSNTAKLATKRRAVSMSQPKSRIVVSSALANVVLPDAPTMTADMGLSGMMSMPGGGIGGGEGGLRGKGKGGLMGDGLGKGVGPGRGAGFVAMFGKVLKAQKLAVVLDVSRSMHPYLPVVVREANKLSGGCPVVLFYGCGAKETEDREIERQLAHPTRGRDFDEFWRRNFTGGDGPPAMDGPMPSEETYRVFDGRKDTYFFEKVGVGFSWLALTSPKIKEADAIYWFADFRDPVETAQLEDVRKILGKRKQKLYVHASGDSNPSLAAVNEILVKPTGGEIMQVNLKPDKVK